MTGICSVATPFKSFVFSLIVFGVLYKYSSAAPQRTCRPSEDKCRPSEDKSTEFTYFQLFLKQEATAAIYLPFVVEQKLKI
jgi:hypothetical protein